MTYQVDSDTLINFVLLSLVLVMYFSLPKPEDIGWRGVAILWNTTSQESELDSVFTDNFFPSWKVRNEKKEINEKNMNNALLSKNNYDSNIFK